ncbi:MAG: helix-turn-helix domain-containing protein [Planctomycetota bacterium]|nr:MAG: helix-turn-helix domain-containing protein [Planctomycetota bacterium]
MAVRQVLLWIESSRAYGRDCLLGIGAFARNRGDWRLIHIERSLDERIVRIPAGQQIDGIISRLDSPRDAATASRFRCPIVDLRGVYPPENGVVIDTDSPAVARMAADHLLERGFRHFGYCGFRGVDFSDDREAVFCEYLQKRGCSVSVFEPGKRKRRLQGTAEVEAQGEFELDDLARWLLDVPKPIGVFACNDVRGRQVVEACRRVNLGVPDRVAVLGVDNDRVVCDLTHPTLSSIEPDARRVGFEGAAALDVLMNGGRVPKKRVLIPPRRVVTRLSTDILAVDCPIVGEALRFIHENAAKGLSVSQVAKAVDVSRSTLDRRFHEVLGRSAKSEIDRVRVRRARELLLETEFNLDTIARLVGYHSAAQFVNAFRRLTGMTPGAVRRWQSTGSKEDDRLDEA